MVTHIRSFAPQLRLAKLSGGAQDQENLPKSLPEGQIFLNLSRMKNPFKNEIFTIAILSLGVICAYIWGFPCSFVSFDSANIPNFIVNFQPAQLDGKPVYIWLGRIIYHVYNKLPRLPIEAFIWMLNFYSAVFGLLTCLNVYFICKHFLGQKCAIGAFLFTAFSPIFFYTSSTIEVYCLNLFFISLSILFWLKRKYDLWGLSFGLALSSHILSALLIFPFLAGMIIYKIRINRKIISGAVIALLISFLCYLWVLRQYPCIFYFLKANWDISKTDYLSRVYFQCGLSNMLRALNTPFLLIAAFSLLLFTFKHQHLKNLIFIYSWLIPYLIFAFVWDQGENTGRLGGQLFIYSSPVLGTLVAITIFLFCQRRLKGRFVAHFFIITVFIQMHYLYPLIPSYKYFSRIEYEYVKDMSKDIPKGSFVICNWDAPWVRFYNPESEISYYLMSSNTPKTDQQLKDFISKIDGYLINNRNVFLSGEWVLDKANCAVLDIFQKLYVISQPNKFLIQLKLGHTHP